MTAFVTMTVQQPQLLLVTLFGLTFFPNDKFSHGSCFNQNIVSNSTTITSTTSPCFAYNHTPTYHPHHHGINPHHPSIYGHRTGYYGFQNPQSPHYGHHHPPERLIFPASGYRPPLVTSSPYLNQLPSPITLHPPVPVRGSYSYPPGYTGPSNYQPPSYSHYNPHHPYYNDIGQYVPHHLPHRYTYHHYHPNHIHSSHHHPPSGFQRRTYLPITAATTHQPHDPIFLGRGTFGIIDGRDAELVCSFNHPQYQIVSNVAWVRVEGPYSFPHFDCHHHGHECKYHYINQQQDFRFRVISSGQTSTLRIYDYARIDFGVYRCAATGQGRDGKTSTLYQVIEFLEPVHATANYG